MSENEQLMPNEAPTVKKKRLVLDYLFFALCGVGVIGYYICLIVYKYADFTTSQRATVSMCADILHWFALAMGAIGLIVIIIKSFAKPKQNGAADDPVLSVYNRYKTLNRLLTFIIPPYILALILAITNFYSNDAVTPMYIMSMIGGCLSALVLFSLILRLVYNKRFKAIGIKTAIPFLTLLFFLIANAAVIAMTLLESKGIYVMDIDGVSVVVGASLLVGILAFVVFSIISFVKLFKKQKHGSVSYKQLIKVFVMLVVVAMSLVAFITPIGSASPFAEPISNASPFEEPIGSTSPQSVTCFGKYTEKDVGVLPDKKGNFVYVEIQERPAAMGTPFFELVSLETGKTYHAGGYKNVSTGEICLNTNGKASAIIAVSEDFYQETIQIFFMIDEPISDQFVLVYSFGDIVKEYEIPANAIQ